jgi:hypothetical protein
MPVATTVVEAAPLETCRRARFTVLIALATEQIASFVEEKMTC